MFPNAGRGVSGSLHVTLAELGVAAISESLPISESSSAAGEIPFSVVGFRFHLPLRDSAVTMHSRPLRMHL